MPGEEYLSRYVKTSQNKYINPFSHKQLHFFSRDILSIEEINHVFTMKFVMLMEWYDYRINFFNLKGKTIF